MDENAENYDDNATSELVGDCIYLAMEEAFIDAMSGVKSIEEMLEDSPKAGYSQSIKMNEFNAEMGMQMDIEMDETVKVDLDNDAVYVHNSFAFVPMMTMEYTHVQVGEVVNVHYAAGGMMGEAESGSYQTRDATPNVLEVLADQVGLFSMSSGEDDMLFPTPEAEVDEDEIPEGAVTTITLDDNMESQTMTMEYTDEEGAEITMTIHIDQNEDLMSYSFHSDNGSATTTLDYQIMWGDAIVIEVNETLPKTSIPVWIDIEPWWDDDDDDTFLCDNGNEIPMDYVDDGWDDCGDGSDESDDGDDDDRDPEQMMDYMDTDDDGYLSLQELIDFLNNDREQNGEEPMSSEDEEGTANWFYSGDTDGDDLLSLDEFTQLLESTGDDDDGDDGDGAPTPEDAMEEVDTDGDGYMDLDEFQEAWEADPENFELDYDEVTILFDDCDYDDNDLIDIDEMQCFIDGIVDMAPDGGGEEWDAWDMYLFIDADEDGHVTASEFADFVNYTDDGEDGEMTEEEFEGLSGLIDMYDYDESGGLDWEEFEPLWYDIFDDGDDGDDGENDVSWMDYYDGYCEWEGNPDGDDTVWWCKYSEDDEYWETWWYYCEFHDQADWHCTDDFGQSEEFEHSAEGDEWSGSDDDDDGDDGDETFICDNGDEVPMDWVNDGWDDCGDGSDEFDDEDDEGQQEMPAVIIGYVAKNQTLNAPISDFETRFLSDCDDEYNEETGEMEGPDLNECTVEFSIPLTGGEANGVTHTYTDLDGDGLVSPGDMLTLEGYDGQTRLEMYDTWASEYSSDSVANPPALPGFGALMALTVMLGAAFATRRD